MLGYPAGDGGDGDGGGHLESLHPVPVSVVPGGEDVQKKFTMLSNPLAVAKELFPHSSEEHPFISSLSNPLMSGDEGRGEDVRRSGTAVQRGSGLVLVASLVTKVPNLGGKI